MFTVRFFLTRDVEYAFNPTYLMDVENVIQSNQFLAQSYDLFVSDTTHLVEVSHKNKSCLLRLETYLVGNSGSLFYPFHGQWFLVGAIIPSIFYFLFYPSLLYANVCVYINIYILINFIITSLLLLLLLLPLVLLLLLLLLSLLSCHYYYCYCSI